MTSYKLYYYQRYFHYFAKHLKLHTFQMEPGQVQTVEVPSSLWNHTPCTLYFRAPSDHHVNITILDQFYEGLSNHGLQRMVELHFVESLRICMNQ